MIDFILASGSPRRKELLELMGLEFKVIVSQADEDSVSKDLKPELYVQELALLKASATAKEVLRNKPEKNKWSEDEQNETSNRAFYETGG